MVTKTQLSTNINKDGKIPLDMFFKDIDVTKKKLSEMRDEYKIRRNFIVKSLNDMGLTCHLPRGSFYAFPCIRSTGLTSKEFATRLVNEQKVACIPGSAFGPSGEGFVRCSFATALDQIEKAMERIQKFLLSL